MSSDKNSKLEKMLLEQEETLKKSSDLLERLSTVNMVIQLKYRLYGESSLNEVYKDAKTLFECLVLSVRERIYGYDHINFVKIDKVLSYFDYQRRYKLCLYIDKVLRNNGFENEALSFSSRLRKEELSYLFYDGWSYNGKIRNLLKIIFSISSFNVYTMILSLIFIVLFSAIILFPAPVTTMGIFSVSYHQYVENEIFNHILNVVSGFVGLESDYKVVPNGAWAFFLIVVSKVFKYLVVGNFLIREIERRARF